MHGLEGAADAEEEVHELALGEAGVVDEVGVDDVLQVAPAVVGEEHVDGLGVGVGAVLGDGVVDGVDDARDVGEGLVGLDLAHGLLHRLGPERAPDLLEREQLGRRRVLHQVHVAEPALAQQPQDLERPAVDLERGRPGEAVQAVPQRVDEV